MAAAAKAMAAIRRDQPASFTRAKVAAGQGADRDLELGTGGSCECGN
jgi:hypothetical protein